MYYLATVVTAMRHGKREVLPPFSKRKYVTWLIAVVDITRVWAKQVTDDTRGNPYQPVALGQVHDHASAFARVTSVPYGLREGNLLAFVHHHRVAHGQIIDFTATTHQGDAHQKLHEEFHGRVCLTPPLNFEHGTPND